MQFVVCFGINYYVISGTMPNFAFYWLNWATGKYGNDLDAGAPAGTRYMANILLKKYGALDA